MPDINSGNWHIDRYLTDFSIAYMNEEFCAGMVFPTVPVGVRSDKYAIYNKNTFLKSSGVDAQGKPLSIRRPGARSTEIQWDISANSYACEQLAKSYPLTDAERNLADDPLQPEIDTTLSLTELVTLDNEIQVANKTHKRGNYASGNKVQLVNGSTSWAAATGKPISVDIPNGKKQVMLGLIKAPTHMLLNYASALTLSQNAEYLDKIKYTSRDGLTRGGLAPIIEGLEVIEARTQKDTTVDGNASIADTTGYVWVDDQATPQNCCLIFYRPPTVKGRRIVALGVTFEAPDDTFHARGFLIKRWREENRDSELIECRTTRDWRFVATDGSTSGDNASGFATGAYLISGCDL